VAGGLGGDGRQVVEDVVTGLARQLRGEVLLPGDPGYDDARQGYNSLHDRRPAVVVRPAGDDDVVRALAFATGTGLEVAVRGGGHSLAGYGATAGGLLLDLSAMRAVHLDPEARVAFVDAGTTAGELTTAAGAHDLAVPFGDSPSVGVGGITLGGGVGWLSRKFGLTIDSLEGVELVTADGRLVTADDRTHEDLFWAVRGGGGNFGVVTRFRFRLHPVGRVLGGALFLPATHEVVRGVLDLAAAAPDELTTISLVTRIPPLSIVPPAAHGRPAVLITLVWCGELQAGERVLAGFRSLAPPIADLLRPMPYPAMYELIPEAPRSVTNITYSFVADELDDEAIGSILERLEEPKLPSTDALAAVELRVLGGAIGRVPVDATAFAHRRRNLLCSVVTAGFSEADAERHRGWVRSLSDAIGHLAKGAYPNFVDAADEARLHEAYPDVTYRRLVEVKRRYDPTNLFHRNLNVRPHPDGL
jgi:FAD/FMN-containing dehydrogenase